MVIDMDAVVMRKLGELLIKKSAIMELLHYIEERAKGGEIKEVREFARDISVSELVIAEREEE